MTVRDSTSEGHYIMPCTAIYTHTHTHTIAMDVYRPFWRQLGVNHFPMKCGSTISCHGNSYI